jgi:hypothetical protein
MPEAQEQTRAWHLLTPEQRRAQCSKACRYCGRAYVNHGKLWVHENELCKKRPLDAPLTLEAIRALLASGLTHARVRPGHGEAGRQVNIDGIYRDWQGAVLIHGTYENFGVAAGGAGMSTTHGGFWEVGDLIAE